MSEHDERRVRTRDIWAVEQAADDPPWDPYTLGYARSTTCGESALRASAAVRPAAARGHPARAAGK
jgi:hypothetical protein